MPSKEDLYKRYLDRYQTIFKESIKNIYLNFTG